MCMYFPFFTPKKHFEMLGCISEVLTLLLTPILTYIRMFNVRAPYMSYMSYMTFITYMTSGIRMSKWVSKEVFGPKECSQSS